MDGIFYCRLEFSFYSLFVRHLLQVSICSDIVFLFCFAHWANINNVPFCLLCLFSPTYPKMHSLTTQFMHVCVYTSISVLSFFCSGAEVSVQLVPEHIGSVNGSNVTMGCASPLVPYEHDELKLCIDSESYLVDGCSPTIDTSTSNWASQLVTARKISDDEHVHFDYALLTFGFNTAVSLTAIELDLFLCPEWSIGAPRITVDASNISDLIKPNGSAEEIVERYDLNQSSCDSLSTVSVPLEADSSYLMWYIQVWFPTSQIDWVHVGEVRFLNGPVAVYPSNGCTPKPSTGEFYTLNLTIYAASA